MTRPLVSVNVTESFMAGSPTPPTLDGVALLEEIRAGLEGLLAEVDRPELHQQILAGFAEARATLARIPGAEEMLAVVERPIPGYEPSQPIRELVSQWLKRRGAALQGAWGFLAPGVPDAALNMSTADAPRSREAPPGQFGAAIRLSTAPEPGRIIVTIDFNELPQLRRRPALVLVLRYDSRELLGEARFDNASGVQTAQLQIEPALIETRQLRVAIGVIDPEKRDGQRRLRGPGGGTA